MCCYGDAMQLLENLGSFYKDLVGFQYMQFLGCSQWFLGGCYAKAVVF